MNVTREVVVLIVEDDPGHVRLIQRNLERAGLHNPIKVFQNGQEVLDFLLGRGSARKREPDTPYLLLLDVRMPQVDGVEVLRQVKAHPELRKIPVSMLTTTDDPRRSLAVTNWVAATTSSSPLITKNSPRPLINLGYSSPWCRFRKFRVIANKWQKQRQNRRFLWLTMMPACSTS
jgi:CheY-like chemotaxis protein